MPDAKYIERTLIYQAVHSMNALSIIVSLCHIER